MEKEKKEKKVVKKTNSKKQVEEKKVVEERVVLGKREKRLIKFGALLSAFFATAVAILVFVFSVIATVSVANLTTEELASNNIVTTVIGKMNNYSSIEVQELILNMSNRFTFILFEIIIPTIAFVGTMLLIVALAKRIIDFISDVTYEKDLFNKKKLENSQDIISIISIVLLATLVIFNEPSIIVYLLIELLLCIIYLLFKNSISLRKNSH